MWIFWEGMYQLGIQKFWVSVGRQVAVSIDVGLDAWMTFTSVVGPVFHLNFVHFVPANFPGEWIYNSPGYRSWDWFFADTLGVLFLYLAYEKKKRINRCNEGSFGASPFDAPPFCRKFSISTKKDGVRKPKKKPRASGRRKKQNTKQRELKKHSVCLVIFGYFFWKLTLALAIYLLLFSHMLPGLTLPQEKKRVVKKIPSLGV